MSQLSIQDLEVRRSGVRVLEKISVTIGSGEIVGLIGENGAGKTTLFKTILGFLRPWQGSVLLDGKPIGPENMERFSFATCEHSFFPWMTGKEHMEFYKMQFPKFKEERFHQLMDFFELSEISRTLKMMSNGEQNQFEVILSLSQGADFILMDEPFLGSDFFKREEFYKILLSLLEPTDTIILSTHLIGEVKNLISRAILLHKGHMLKDISMDELENTGISLADYIRENYPDNICRPIDPFL